MRRPLTILAGLLALSTGARAEAQVTLDLPRTGTEVIDPYWQVRCEQIDGPENPACDYAGTGWQQARRVLVQPPAWGGVPTEEGTYYISLLHDASVWGKDGENPRYRYTYRTTFDLGEYDPEGASILLYNFWIDNYWLGWSLNGAPLSLGGITPTPNQPGPFPYGRNWNQAFQLQIFDGFVEGVNTLELVVSGNGHNDGIMVEGDVIATTLLDPDRLPTTTTPEPVSLALLGSGLAGVGALRRRRRRRD